MQLQVQQQYLCTQQNRSKHVVPKQQPRLGCSCQAGACSTQTTAAAAVAAPARQRCASPAALGVFQQACRSSARPSNTSSMSRRNSVALSAVSSSQATSPPSSSKPLEPLIQVSVNTTSGGVAKAVLLRLQQLGKAEIWATSAANHFTAVAGLGLAAQQLQQQPAKISNQQQPSETQQQQPLLEGLAATAVMSSHDQPVKDQQKRRLFKLELQLQPADKLDPAVFAPGQSTSISTNRVTNIASILASMQQQLLEVEDASSSRVKPGAVCVVEARGEQAVTRALKAALSLQAAAGQQLLLRPIAGKVVDIVAEKRGQSQLADGLLLLFMWA